MNARTVLAVVLRIFMATCVFAAASVLAAPWAYADEGAGALVRDRVPRLDPEAEQAAARLLEAMKQGDDKSFVRMLDLTALYHEAVRQDETERSIGAYWRFIATVRRAVQHRFASGPVDEFDYEIVSSEQDGAATTVTVAFRIGVDEPWQQVPVAFEIEGRKRKLTLEGMRAFDFGYGERGPISRRGALKSAEAAIETMLEAVKEGDIETFMEYIDLKGMYDMMSKEMGGADIGLPEFEQWKKQLIEMAKDNKPEEGFDYEIVEVEEQDNTATATIKVKESVDDDWQEHSLEFKRMDGEWKLTMESMMEMGD